MSEKIITSDSASFTDEQRRLITDVLVKGGSPTEVAFFFQVAERLKLDPFKRQIHAMKRWDGTLRREVLQFMVSIEGLRSIACRCKTEDGKDAYAGSSKPKFTYKDSEKKHLHSAEVTILKIVQGEPREFTAEAFYDECVQMRNVYDGSGNGKQKIGEEPNSMWEKRPHGQLGKCAEAAALRKAFPEETGGAYIEEEFAEDAHYAEERVRVRTPKPEAEGMAPMVDAELVQEAAPPRHWSDLLLENAYNLVKFETGEYAGKALWEVAKDKADFQKAYENVPRDDQAIRHALDARYYANLKKRLADKGYDEPAAEKALREAGFLNDAEGLHQVDGSLLLDLGTAIKELPDLKKA
jgi:phage recombination protein Bet